MQTAVIIDAIVAAGLLTFLIYGARRGLFRSVAGLAIMLIALVGAGIAASVLTPTLSASMQPWVEKRVEARLDAAFAAGDSDLQPQEPQITPPGETELPGENGTGEVNRLLSLLGLDQDPAAAIADSVQEKVHDTGVSILTAVVESVAETTVHVLVYALAFLLLLILLKILMHAVDLVLKLPGLHLLNHTGGAAVGLIEGALALFLGIWILRRFGVSFDTEIVQNTVLLRFFTMHTPLSVLSFL